MPAGPGIFEFARGCPFIIKLRKKWIGASRDCRSRRCCSLSRSAPWTPLPHPLLAAHQHPKTRTRRFSLIRVRQQTIVAVAQDEYSAHQLARRDHLAPWARAGPVEISAHTASGGLWSRAWTHAPLAQPVIPGPAGAPADGRRGRSFDFASGPTTNCRSPAFRSSVYGRKCLGRQRARPSSPRTRPTGACGLVHGRMHPRRSA